MSGTRAYRDNKFIEHIENGGDIGPDERKLIVELLRNNLPNKTGPKRNKKREEMEAKIVFEIERIMYLWGVKANRAQRMLYETYDYLNNETVATYWKKYRQIE